MTHHNWQNAAPNAVKFTAHHATVKEIEGYEYYTKRRTYQPLGRDAQRDRVHHDGHRAAVNIIERGVKSTRCRNAASTAMRHPSQ